MRINNNMMAMNTHRQLGLNQNAGSKSIEKLSSGFRINRAGDDAAGLSISEKMRGQIRGLNQASRNAQDGISMIQTGEGALNETHAILQRMRELAVQASNETLQPEDSTAIGEELLTLKVEVDRIADNTEFNGKKLLNGSLATQVAGASELKTGSVVSANATIAGLDVSGAVAGTTFTLSAGTAANELVMSASVNGVATSQTVTVQADTQTLNFSSFGIKIDVAGTETAANIRTGLVGAANDTITTDVGNSAAKLQIGANAGQTMSITFGDSNTDKLGTGGS